MSTLQLRLQLRGMEKPPLIDEIHSSSRCGGKHGVTSATSFNRARKPSVLSGVMQLVFRTELLSVTTAAALVYASTVFYSYPLVSNFVLALAAVCTHRWLLTCTRPLLATTVEESSAIDIDSGTNGEPSHERVSTEPEDDPYVQHGGQACRIARKAKTPKITSATVAKEMCKDRAVISRIESGKSTPRLSFVKEYAEVIGDEPASIVARANQLYAESLMNRLEKKGEKARCLRDLIKFFTQSLE